MCIGNLRSATQNMCDFTKSKDRQKLLNGILYFGIIGCFIVGAIISNGFIEILGKRAILVSAMLLILAFLVMFIDREESLLKKNKIK